METNGTTRIEMDTMHAIINSSKSLEIISDTLNDILKAIDLPRLCLTDDDRRLIFREVALARAHEAINQCLTSDEIERIDIEEVLKCFSIDEWQLKLIAKGWKAYEISNACYEDFKEELA